MIFEDKSELTKGTFAGYSTNAPLVLKPLTIILGLTAMKLRLPALLILIICCGFQSEAQKQNPSFLYQNRIISYSITRYTPSWEVQAYTEQGSELEAGSKLFKDLKSTQTGALKSLMYLKGFEPTAVKSLTSSELIDHWKRNRVRMYYRIKYQGRNIFLARLNDHSSRSILPFKDQSGIWELDLDFMKDPLFECLQDVNFDPFTGKFLGNSSAAIAFDGIENGLFIDYSGNDTEVPAQGVDLLKGRIGKCARIDSKSTLTIPFGSNTDDRSFFLDCHINLEDAIVNEKQQIVFESQAKYGGIRLTTGSKDGLANFELGFTFENGRRTFVDFSSIADAWFHLNITANDRFISVSIDGSEVSSFQLNRSDVLVAGDLVFGGEESAKFKLDELTTGH